MENGPRKSGCVEAGIAGLGVGLACLFATFVPATFATILDQLTPRVSEYGELTENLMKIPLYGAIPAFAIGVLGGIYLSARSRRPHEK